MTRYFLLIACALISCGHPAYKDPHVIIDTRFGEIEIELYPDKAPKTVAAFLANVDAGTYNNGSFYRVLKAEELPTDYNPGLIQGGVWKAADGDKRAGNEIELETTKRTGLSHTDGIISMARKDSSKATTEFFICIGDQSSLDSGRTRHSDGLGFAAFGKVYRGMDIVKKIQAQPGNGDHFRQAILINSIRRS